MCESSFLRPIGQRKRKREEGKGEGMFVSARRVSSERRGGRVRGEGEPPFGRHGGRRSEKHLVNLQGGGGGRRRRETVSEEITGRQVGERDEYGTTDSPSSGLGR